MRTLEIGLVLPTGDLGDPPTTRRWDEIRTLALRAEEMGFDTVWSPDELLWRPADKPQRGFWDGVAMAGAISAVTSRIKVGSWVMAALHRNAGIIAKAVESVDEISHGRFVFGLGAGHAWPGQAHAFGLPEDHVYERFEEALQIIVPLLRGGHVDFEGRYHAAHDLDQLPRGPRPGQIPIMLAGHGPKGCLHAARLADIWSCYAGDTSDLADLQPKLDGLVAACAEVGRDLSTIGRSAGVEVAPLAVRGAPDAPSGAIAGSAEEIADTFRGFRAAGFTSIEVLLAPLSIAALEAMPPVLELLDSD